MKLQHETYLFIRIEVSYIQFLPKSVECNFVLDEQLLFD